MLEFLFKTILVLICLVIIIPLILLLFGETRLMAWIFDKSEPAKTEQVVRSNSTEQEITSKTITFDKVWIQHHVMDGDVDGLQIHVAFNAYYMQDETGYCCAKFFDKNQNVVKNHKTARYRDGKYDMQAVVEFKNPQLVSPHPNFCLYIPYDVLDTYEEDGKVAGFVIYWVQLNEQKETIILGHTNMYLFNNNSEALKEIAFE